MRNKVFISFSNTEEGMNGAEEVIKEVKRLNMKPDFFDESVKRITVSENNKQLITDKISNCGVTILVLSSDFLDINHHLLRENQNGRFGWNFEELNVSLVWNKLKMHNSIILTYTEEFYIQYLENSRAFSFPIINDNINNVNNTKASENDSNNYMEVISLNEFINNSKYYLTKLRQRKIKQSFSNLYDLKFI
ncbi:MAG: hypothetical protein KFW07_04295 [Mycoplasmataceae bacterium]|nr:hypothetical protein [Mycoplasmataceae bacterium]